jgi:hypothetical protein
MYEDVKDGFFWDLDMKILISPSRITWIILGGPIKKIRTTNKGRFLQIQYISLQLPVA